MEDGGNGFSNGDRGQIGNSSRLGFWEIGTSRFDWTTNPFYSEDTSATTTPVAQQALMHHHQHLQVDNAHTYQYPSIYAGVSHVHPDPHLTCLKLGKRDYFEDGSTLTTPLFQHHLAAAAFPLGKRGKPYGGLVGGGHSSSLTVSVPRCLVEGCHAALFNAKDYHRRHKVCEMHSKAPKVLVLGLEQRFCQQCSRFHVVSEFDDSKRSCRRRLAGHNERRRKSSNESITKNPSRESKTIGGRFSSLSSSEGRALSLLSSKSGSWVLPSDLSLRSSAALDELIAENRASTFARQIFFNRDTMDELCGAQPGLLPHIPHQQHMPPEQPEWDRFHGSGEHLTLDLMQAPSSASPFGFLSTGRNKIKEDEDECGEIWKSLEGTHMI